MSKLEVPTATAKPSIGHNYIGHNYNVKAEVPTATAKPSKGEDLRGAILCGAPKKKPPGAE